MARITVEDCLQKVNNRFSLIHMASKRVRELRKGAEPTVSAKNRDIVLALREIAAGKVTLAPQGKADSLKEPDHIDLPPEKLPDLPDLPDRPDQAGIELFKEEQDMGGEQYLDLGEEGFNEETLDEEDFDEEDFDGEDLDDEGLDF